MKKTNSWLWLIAGIFWTIVIGSYAGHEIINHHDDIIEHALLEARSSFDKDVLYRQWAAGHGGVYVPVTAKTPPNPYLKNIPERDIETLSGRQLTLLNPAYITRQVYELAGEQHGVKGHITSLKPLRPENRPNSWEAEALQSFKKGITSAHSISEHNGESYLTAMFPLLVEERCLKCHVDQGYQLGDIRGGISMVVPLKPRISHFQAALPSRIVFHVCVWIIGIFCMFLSRMKINKQFLVAELALEASRKSEEELRKQKSRFVKAQELGKVGGWELDLQQSQLQMTDETCRIFGMSLSAEMNYEFFLEKVHPDDRNLVEQERQAALDEKSYDIEYRLIIDGETVWVHEKADVNYDKNGKAVNTVGFTQDITELKDLQEKMIRAAQLASVGELSASIAHEVNNPLSGIIGYAQILINRADDDCRDKALLTRIVKEGDRIAKTVRGLLTFSYDSGDQKSLQDIGPIIFDALSLMSPQIDKNGIHLDVELPNNLPRLKCNSQQIEQVILNIVRNAYQALLEGVLEGNHEKTIKVEAGLIEIGQTEYVQIKIANNGPNIPEKLIPKINVSFFTTKPVGFGTGLGLSISNDIMKNHNGSLDIKSAPGEYTEMILRLPVAE